MMMMTTVDALEQAVAANLKQSEAIARALAVETYTPVVAQLKVVLAFSWRLGEALGELRDEAWDREQAERDERADGGGGGGDARLN